MTCSRTIVIVIAFLGSSALQAHEVTAPISIESFPLDEVSPHIRVVHGPLAQPSPENRGFMNNPAAILTANGIIVVDPGSSRNTGRQLVEKVRRIWNKPVVAIFNTHVHGDHWLGNDGVRELYPNVPIYAHERMIERANAGEGEFWINVFKTMTKGTAGETKAVAPTIGLKGGEEIRIDDVTLKIHYAGHAHSDNDLMIEVLNDRSLFTGDIVLNHHVPNSDVPQDASFKGSITAIEAMLKGPYSLYVPGHGRTGGREVPEAMLRFHRKLYDLVMKFYRDGQQDYEMKDRIVNEMSEYRDWHNFSEMGRVIGYVYREIEKDDF